MMMRIGQLAERAGMTADGLRYYEDLGLIHPRARTEAGYRLYDEEALDRLRFIRRAQELGLRLEEIRGILEIRAGGRPPCRHVRELLAKRLAEVEARIAELEKLRAELRSRLDWAEAHPDPRCDERDVCVYLASPPGR
ncbi:MAG: heavy metal-responsive transcriptional regulator [Bacillota bacterium]|nr:heavy metal-responsive transcriptional regulator [Bacillota bacterium]